MGNQGLSAAEQDREIENPSELPDEINREEETPAEEPQSTAPAEEPPESTEPEATATGDEPPGEVDEPPEIDKFDKLSKQIDKIGKRVGYLMRTGAQPQQQTPPEETPAETPPEKPESDVPRPKEDDFDSYEDYQEAVTDWKVDKKIAEMQAAQQKAETEDAGQEEAEKAFQEKMDKGSEKYSDFEDVALDPTVPINAVMAEIIKESDMTADLAYYLGKNRKEAAAITRMTPTQAAKEIGKLEAKLELEFKDDPPPPDTDEEEEETPALSEKKTTKAPPAIKPIKSSANSGISKDPQKMSNEEYRNWRLGK